MESSQSISKTSSVAFTKEDVAFIEAMSRHHPPLVVPESFQELLASYNKQRQHSLCEAVKDATIRKRFEKVSLLYRKPNMTGLTRNVAA